MWIHTLADKRSIGVQSPAGQLENDFSWDAVTVNAAAVGPLSFFGSKKKLEEHKGSQKQQSLVIDGSIPAHLTNASCQNPAVSI